MPNRIRIYAAIITIVLTLGVYTGALEAKTTVDNTEKTDTPDISKTILSVLPDSTDVQLAKQNREPRNVRSGYYIIIRKSIHKLSLYKDGTLVKSYSVGTGKNTKDKEAVDDCATPEGHFNVKQLFDSTDWIYTPPHETAKYKHVFGPWFFSVNTDSTGTFSGGSWVGIGIHGTNHPESVGKNVSHGCIRLHNEDVRALKKELELVADITSVPVDIIH
jgi:hypothetical protein